MIQPLVNIRQTRYTEKKILFDGLIREYATVFSEDVINPIRDNGLSDSEIV